MNVLVVGAGLFGAVVANKLSKENNQILVIDKRDHVAGNIYTKKVDGINIHEYGAHIFHTSNKKVWHYINQFAEFNRFTNSPIANYKGEIYNLPFNMNTFNKLWGVIKPEEAQKIIQEQREILHDKIPENLEEQAISLVGTDIYIKLIKDYTEKQWGRLCTELPAFIIKRLPVRFTYDNNYFDDAYQGIPIGGYTQIVEKMLDHENIEVQLETDFFDRKKYYLEKFDKIIYTGMIDEFFEFKYGNLEYRSLRFESKKIKTANYQGNAVVNYTDAENKFTRIIEHKHFDQVKTESTFITKEFPSSWKPGEEPYYPINDEKNNSLLKKYQELALKESKVAFGGRLGMYKYYDMDDVILAAMDLLSKTKKSVQL